MLQFMNNLPDHVVGIHAVGEVTKDDYDQVLKPRLDDLEKRQGEINYLLVLDNNVQDFTVAAWWQDFLVGIKHFTHWNKIAVVSDQKAVERFTNFFTHFIPGKSKGFPSDQEQEAIQWISETELTHS
jgi:hypothetical protein